MYKSTKIDLNSDERPKRGVKSVTAPCHVGRRKKEVANEFPPGIVQVVRTALFQQTETLQCGANLVRNLCAQSSMPPESIARELLDAVKCFHYKNPMRTHFAHLYASGLVSASARLVRRNGKAIFGPSSWDDIEVLLSQSTDRAVATSGIRLTHELQTAACGAKLLSLMLKTELLDYDLSSTEFDFNSESLKAKPTVVVMKKQGLRNVLKTVTRHTSKCLLRHAKYLLDSDVYSQPSGNHNHTACCASEAKTCLDNLGSVICYTAWLLCAEERISIEHQTPAFVVRDTFLSELSLCDDTLPRMNSKKKKMFIINLKLCFLLSLREEFAYPLEEMVGGMIGLEVKLDRSHEKAAKQKSNDVPEVINDDGGSENQLARKSSVPIMVQRKNELVEAYELEKKNSSLFWVEFASDGKCEPISSDKIFRGRKRKPRSSSRPTHEIEPHLLYRGKSCRVLTGDYKITPLDTSIIREDLSLMKTYENACKRFCIESYISRKDDKAVSRSSTRSYHDFPTYIKDGGRISPGQGKTTTNMNSEPDFYAIEQQYPLRATGEKPIISLEFESSKRKNEFKPTAEEPTASEEAHFDPIPFPFARNSSVPVLAQRQNEVVETNEIDKEDDMKGESSQLCRYCQRSFSIASGDLFRHEVSCPVKIQVPQSLQQESRNKLQQHQLEEQAQLQGPNLPTQNVVSPPQALMTCTDLGFALTSQHHGGSASSQTYSDIILKKLQLKNEFCQFILHRGVDYSDLDSLHQYHLLLSEELSNLHQLSSHVRDCLTVGWKGSPLQTLQSLKIQTGQNIRDSERLAFVQTFAPREAHQWQQPQNQEQSLDTPSVDPIHHNWAPYLHSTSWTPDHSRTAEPQEPRQWQHTQNQEQLLGTLQVDPIHHNWAPYIPSTPWTPDHSRTAEPQEPRQWQHTQNQEQLLGTLQVDPIHHDWAPHPLPASWAPDHSRTAEPQEPRQWQHTQNQEQLLGTLQVDPIHHNWAPYIPSASWAPDHSRATAPHEEQQCQQPQNYEHLALPRQRFKLSDRKSPQTTPNH